TLEEQRSLQKDAKTIMAAVALAIQIGRELQPGGVLRRLILYLHQLGSSRDEILRLRLTEPEEVDRILETAFNFTDFARTIYVDPNRPAAGEVSASAASQSHRSHPSQHPNSIMSEALLGYLLERAAVAIQ